MVTARSIATPIKRTHSTVTQHKCCIAKKPKYYLELCKSKLIGYYCVKFTAFKHINTRQIMSNQLIAIGDKLFNSKSEALAFYKNILSSYEPGSTLDRSDNESIIELINMDYINEELEYYMSNGYGKQDKNLILRKIKEKITDFEIENGDAIKSIVVDNHPDFKHTKCFFIVHTKNEKTLFSYRLAINGNLPDDVIFSRACRHLVNDQIREFKKGLFKNRPVRCAITNEIVEWEECQIDHKAPLTFSVIIKAFIVANKIDISSIDYFYDGSIEKFTDKDLAGKFKEFHSHMAVLRLISTKENNKLAASCRIKPTRKDGTINTIQR
jgi:hypothetical protein